VYGEIGVSGSTVLCFVCLFGFVFILVWLAGRQAWMGLQGIGKINPLI